MSTNHKPEKRKKSVFSRIIVILGTIALLLFAALMLVTYHPTDEQPEKAGCNNTPPVLSAGQTIKIMSWNVEAFTGPDYTLINGWESEDGESAVPDTDSINANMIRIAEIITAESPDIILIQEISDNDVRFDYSDQLSELLSLLPDEYSCSSSAHYWKSLFFPKKSILGPVGIQLSIISRYKMTGAVRYQLPQAPGKALYNLFDFKRCVLKVRFPVSSGDDLIVMNTVLDPYRNDTNHLENQMAEVYRLTTELDEKEVPWIIGGNFRSLHSPASYGRLSPQIKESYNPTPEITIFESNAFILPLEMSIDGTNTNYPSTYYPQPGINRNAGVAVDYVMFSTNLIYSNYSIPYSNAINYSRHLPVIALISLQSN